MYDAFISYSHAADGKLAPALQRGLQGFAKPWYRRRGMRVFRDQTSLAASPELWPTIVRALSEARYFILLASPEAAASRWVAREVAWWRENRSPQTLLIALTGGELVWDEATGDFDWERTTALPTELRGAFASEPLWVDLRWAKSETDLSNKHPAFIAAIADLAATIHNIPKDDLVGEDVRQHRRTRLTAAAAIAALALLAVAATAAGIVALGQRDEARRQSTLAASHAATAEADRGLAVAARATAESERAIAVSRQLGSQARLLQDEHFDTALLLAVEAVRQSPSVEARQALLTLLSSRSALHRFLWNTDGSRGHVTFVGDGDRLVTAGGGIELWDLQQEQVVARIDDPANRFFGSAMAVSPDRQTLAVGGCSEISDDDFCRRGSIQFFTADTLAPLSEPIPAHDAPIDSIAFSPDGTRLATASFRNAINLWDVPGRRLLVSFQSGLEEGVGPMSLAFSPDGSYLAIGGPNASNAVGGTGIRLWEVRNDRPRPALALDHDRGVADILFTDDGLHLLGGSPTGLFMWDLQNSTSPPTSLLEERAITGLAVDRQAGLIYAGDFEGTISFLDLATGELLGAMTDGLSTSGANDIAISPDGYRFAVQSDPATMLWAWDTSTLSRDLPVEVETELTLAGWPDPTTLRLIVDQQRVVDLPVMDSDQAPAAGDSPVALSPPASTDLVVAGTASVLAWSAQAGTTISLFDPSGQTFGTETRQLRVPAGVMNLALTPDSQHLVAILDDDTIRVWRVSDLKEVASVSPLGKGTLVLPNLGRSLVINQLGTRLAVTNSLRGSIAVLELPSLQPVLPQFELQPVTGMALDMVFTPDGEALIVAGSSGGRGNDAGSLRQSNLSRWELSGDSAVGSVLVDGFGTRLVATSPDGRLLAYTRSYFQQTDIYLWDLEQDAALGYLGPADSAAAVSFSPDSAWLAIASGGMDWMGNPITPRLVLYSVDVERWQATACAVVARELTAEEWQFYLGDVPQRPTCGLGTLAAAQSTPVAQRHRHPGF